MTVRTECECVRASVPGVLRAAGARPREHVSWLRVAAVQPRVSRPARPARAGVLPLPRTGHALRPGGCARGPSVVRRDHGAAAAVAAAPRPRHLGPAGHADGPPGAGHQERGAGVQGPAADHRRY